MRSVFAALMKRSKLYFSNVPYSTTARLQVKEDIIKEQIIKVGKYEINYVKVGHGPHSVLFGPGTLGTIWSHCKHQIEGFDRDKFSLVVCDPPGSGKSTIPENDNTINYFARDADVYFEFMKALEIPKYSFVGWSGSGASGLILAAKHPEVICKLVVFGTISHMVLNDLENYKKLKDLNYWSKSILDAMIEIYGKESFVKRLNKWLDNLLKNYPEFNFDGLLKDIKSPTMILYGEKDHIVDSSHVKYLQKHIKNSTVEGKHNIHIKYAEDFNRRVQDFLLQTDE